MLKITFSKTIYILFLIFGYIQFSFSQESLDYIDQELIVTFKADYLNESSNSFNNTRLKQIETLLGVNEYKLSGHKKKQDTYVIKYSNTFYSVNQAIDLYSTTNYFSVVEPNKIMTLDGVAATEPSDNAYFLQWSLKNTGTLPFTTATAGADMDMELAWDIQQGDNDMIVAVIDGGIKVDHPELANRFWININETQDNTDSDANGYIDDVFGGWNFVNNSNDIIDTFGHGTVVTGIVGVNSNNAVGFAGINWNCKFMICKVFNTNSGSTSNVIEGIYYAVDNGAKIINMSLGGSGSSSMLAAVNYAYNNGVIIIASMGNDNTNTVRYPAGYSNVIAVGATNPDDTRSAPFFWSTTSGSNYGSHIDVVAPGNYIWGLNHTSNTSWSSYFGGTSQAAPMVAGITSLLLSENPNLTFEEIRTIIRESAEDQVGDPAEDILGWDQYYGAGRVNAYNALTHELLSTDEFVSDNLFTLYPNPLKSNNQTLSIENLKLDKYDIIIYNSIGQKQLELTLDNTIVINSEIDLSKLSAGNYFVKIKSSSGNIETKKLIIY